MKSLTDTHCHLNFPEFDVDRIHLLDEFKLHGIQRILVPSVDINSSAQVMTLCHKYPDVLFPALGIHPNHSNHLQGNELDELAGQISDPSVRAVGEVGLDFYRDWSPKDTQISVFSKMLDLASEFNLPICIHNRKADDVLLPMLENWVARLAANKSNLLANPGVFHAFDGSPRVAKWAVTHHFKLGICGNITYQNAIQIRDTIKSIDIGHLLLETDSPYLTPEPKRGQRNDPRNLILIAQTLSEVTGRALDDVIKITSINAAKLFKW